MCGIAGVYFNKKNKKSELENIVNKMVQQQVNRGPDNSGIFVDVKDNIAFGHNRLSIIDLSKAGRQPMKLGDLKITFNGEIYNFLELKKDLEKKGHKFKTKTDTEVILALYAEYGAKSFKMLRGMFAFGFWDGKNKKLFLVKDRYGIKPLYYYSDGEKLIFASTVKAVVESELVPNEKEKKAWIGFLLFGSVPLPFTTIKNIFAIPPGHYLEFGVNGKKQLVEYYNSLEFFQKKKEISFDEAEKNVKILLDESVNLHLISDAPLGIFLSGGVDSSAIAALACRSLSESGLPLSTLSIVFDELEFSEQKYQQLMAKKIKSNHREIKITKKDFEESLNEIFEAMDQPTIDGVNAFFIAKAAKEAGLKTVLSGLGADEIFMGYPSFRRAFFLKKIQKLPEILKLPLKFFSLFGGRWSKLGYLKNDAPVNFYLAIRGLFTPREISQILNINVKEVNDFISELAKLTKLQTDKLDNLDPADLLSYLELRFYLQNQLLKDTDFMSMHHSIEVRVPFLDHKLVEYLSSLPPEMKLRNRESANSKQELMNINKPLLAEAVRNLLPEEIFTRPKMGFTFPFQKWLTQYFKNDENKLHWSRVWILIILKNYKI